MYKIKLRDASKMEQKKALKLKHDYAIQFTNKDNYVPHFPGMETSCYSSCVQFTP